MFWESLALYLGAFYRSVLGLESQGSHTHQMSRILTPLSLVFSFDVIHI